MAYNDTGSAYGSHGHQGPLLEGMGHNDSVQCGGGSVHFQNGKYHIR